MSPELVRTPQDIERRLASEGEVEVVLIQADHETHETEGSPVEQPQPFEARSEQLRPAEAAEPAYDLPEDFNRPAMDILAFMELPDSHAGIDQITQQPITVIPPSSDHRATPISSFGQPDGPIGNIVHNYEQLVQGEAA